MYIKTFNFIKSNLKRVSFCSILLFVQVYRGLGIYTLNYEDTLVTTNTLIYYKYFCYFGHIGK